MGMKESNPSPLLSRDERPAPPQGPPPITGGIFSKTRRMFRKYRLLREEKMSKGEKYLVVHSEFGRDERGEICDIMIVVAKDKEDALRIARTRSVNLEGSFVKDYEIMATSLHDLPDGWSY